MLANKTTENLNNDDSDAKDDALSKMNLYFNNEIRSCRHLFGTLMALWKANYSVTAFNANLFFALRFPPRKKTSIVCVHSYIVLLIFFGDRNYYCMTTSSWETLGTRLIVWLLAAGDSSSKRLFHILFEPPHITRYTIQTLKETKKEAGRWGGNRTPSSRIGAKKTIPRHLPDTAIFILLPKPVSVWLAPRTRAMAILPAVFNSTMDGLPVVDLGEGPGGPSPPYLG